jgi:hypothetical protein
MQHLPVSELTLNASVTRLSAGNADFPSADEGIAMWREAQGGVFDIPLAEIVGIVDRQMSGASPPASDRKSRGTSGASVASLAPTRLPAAR